MGSARCGRDRAWIAFYNRDREAAYIGEEESNEGTQDQTCQRIGIARPRFTGVPCHVEPLINLMTKNISSIEQGRATYLCPAHATSLLQGDVRARCFTAVGIY